MREFVGSSKGFTLIELLVVIAIVAIGSAVSVPMLKDFSARYRLRGVARDVTSILQLTRLEAIKRKANCVVIFGESVNGVAFDYVAFVDDSVENFAYDSGEAVLSSRNFPDSISLGSDGVTFTANGAGKSALAFNSRGLPKDYDGGTASGKVHLKNNITGEKEVIVGSSGRVQIQ